MSFEILYLPCRRGTEPVERKNPFTGEIQRSLPVVPLAPAAVRAVKEVLAAAGVRNFDEFGCVEVKFGDGGGAEVFADPLETGCTVAIQGITPDLLRFLFNLLRAADWVLFPAMEGNPAIVSSPGLAGDFADSFPEVVCNSPEELGAVLLPRG